MTKWHRMEHISDIIFVVGETQQEFKLHKTVLAAASDVFEMMFYGNLPENGPVKISDIKTEDFIEVLNFIYGQDVKLTDTNKFHILYAAEKYMLTNLKRKCENFIVECLTKDNIYDILELSQPFNSDIVDNSCLALITQNPLQYFEEDKFMQLSGAVLKKIISQPKINCTSEDLKEMTLQWLKWSGHKVPENGKFDDETYKILERNYQINVLEFEHKEFLGELKALVLPTNIQRFRYTNYQLPLLNCMFQGFGLCLGVQPELEENTLSTTHSNRFAETVRIRLSKTYGQQLSECVKTVTQTTQGMYILNVMVKEMEIRNEHIVLNVDFGSEKNRASLDSCNRVVSHLLYKSKEQQTVKYVRL
jgi:BTB/POZ domain